MLKGRKILFFFVIVLMFIPLLQEYFHFFKIKPLLGSYSLAAKPEIGFKQWFSGSCQDSLNDYYNQNFTLRPVFVRVNNQLDFSLFKKTNAKKVVIGKSGVLFENNYLLAWQGADFIGEKQIDSIVNLASSAQNLLAQKGVDMLVVLAPGKASFFPEYIPAPYNKKVSKLTNYEIISKKCQEKGIHYIDLNRWFSEIKSTSLYPLYPKCGIHWSEYGMFLASDTIIKTIESKRKVNLPDMYIENIEMTKQQLGLDYDIGNALNLLFPINAYPMAKLQIGYSNTTNYKPDVLVIGDSYYWNIYLSSIPGNVFRSKDFWYYNLNVYNDGTNTMAATTNTLDYKSEILKRDVIIILQTDGGLNNFGFNFFTDVINTLNNPGFNDRVEQYRQAILNDATWKKSVEEKARQRNIPFEEMLLLDAKYMAEHEVQ